jgi:GNAT superfamily N-acetyltransferase
VGLAAAGPARRPGRRAHRTVVLPRWQGVGVGSRLSDAAAEWHRLEGCEYTGQTVHPRFGRYRDGSPLWHPTIWNHTTQRLKIESWAQARGRAPPPGLRRHLDPGYIYFAIENPRWATCF